MNKENDESNEKLKITNILNSVSETTGCTTLPTKDHLVNENEINFSPDFIDIEKFTIITSNDHVTATLPSRVLTGDFAPENNSKTIEIDPDDLLDQENSNNDHVIHLRFAPFISPSKNQKTREKEQNNYVLDNIVTSKFTNQNLSRIVNSSHNFSIVHDSSVVSDSNFTQVVNKTPQHSTINTAVEQPNVGPCSCFICGKTLINSVERISFQKTHKLLCMNMPLLELLSDIVNQTVITNTDSIDLCSKCSELMNEVDITFRHFKDLKKEINTLFSLNERPKLTFHVFSKSSSSSSSPAADIPKPSVNKEAERSLLELAYTRPRRGCGLKKNNDKNSLLNTSKKLTKKTVGRPRKPFQCKLCKLKFLTQSTIDKHMVKEHNIDFYSNNSVVAPVEQVSVSSIDLKSEYEKTGNKDKKEESIIIIEDESTSFDEKESNTVCSMSVPQLSKLPNMYDSVDHSLFLTTLRPIHPKPQTVVQTGEDGTMLLFMNPVTEESPPTLIKVSPGFFDLKAQNHQCEICQKVFLDRKGYKMHKIAAHGLRKRKVSSGGYSDDNNKKNISEKLWSCDVCADLFSSKKDLLDHKKISHNDVSRDLIIRNSKRDKVFTCAECDEVFNFKYEYESHKDSHLPFNQTGPHEFICCLCGLKVASKAALKIHLNRFHMKEENTKFFLCHDCGYMACTKKSLIDHSKVHNNESQEKKQCLICHKELLPSSYKIHMLRMHGESKFPCDKCGQRFTVRSNLMKHLNTVHSTLRPYECILCGEKFVTAESLRYHKNKVHCTIFHSCNICGKFYKWKGELRTHKNRCHNSHKTRHQCSMCPRSFADRKKFIHHITVKHEGQGSNTWNQNSACENQIKAIEIRSSDYNRSDEMMNPPHPLQPKPPTLTLPCSSSNQPSVHLVQSETEFDSLHSYETIEVSTLASLETHIPLHPTDHELHKPLSPHSDVLAHFHNSEIRVSSPHNLLETHESLSSTLAPIVSKSHGHQQHLAQDLSSIYLVSEIPVTLGEK